MSISIEVQDLKKRLGPNQALDGLNLSLAGDRIHGVIGPEGAGKTTLLRTLIDLLHPDSGRIRFFESENEKDNGEVLFASIRDGVAYMPQSQSLYPDLSVREHMDFFKELYRIPDGAYEERREELLHMTRMKSFESRPAGKLSGGMYKKLGLMCALLRSPRVLLLDEPTNGVDPISRREFWELIHRYSLQKILIVVTTAYMDEAERCGRVHLMHQGRLLAEGEPQALLQEERVTSFDELYLKWEGI